MGVILAFVVGYVFGARAGREGLQELVESSKIIINSPELRRMLGNVASMASTTVKENVPSPRIGSIKPGRSANG